MDQTTAKNRPAAFLDRDGVLNVDKGYVCKASDFVWIDGAPEAVRYANESGFVVIVVTNQSGIARGYYEEKDVQALHSWMNEDLEKQGAKIDAFYYCPYHPEGTVPNYRRHSDFRKPGPGMIFQAISEWGIDKTRSFLIGDKDKDILAAERAGLRSSLFHGENLYDLMVECIGASRPATPC